MPGSENSIGLPKANKINAEFGKFMKYITPKNKNTKWSKQIRSDFYYLV